VWMVNCFISSALILGGSAILWLSHRLLVRAKSREDAMASWSRTRKAVDEAFSQTDGMRIHRHTDATRPDGKSALKPAALDPIHLNSTLALKVFEWERGAKKIGVLLRLNPPSEQLWIDQKYGLIQTAQSIDNAIL